MQRSWAVVLGCSSGVGSAIARQVAAEPGLNVFGAHRGNWLAEADALKAEIEGRECRGEFFVGDVGTEAGVQAGADALMACAPPRSVRLFVHSLANASLGLFMPGGSGVHRQFIPRNFHKTLDAMANSFVWWAQALVERDLLAPEARLFGLTNPIADSLVANFGLITAAKAALEMYIKHLALEMGAMGHRVNLINFGTVDTQAAEMGFGPRWNYFRTLSATATAERRIVTAEEVAALVSWLLDDRAAWFNGATIDFTGGQAQYLLEAALRINE